MAGGSRVVFCLMPRRSANSGIHLVRKILRTSFAIQQPPNAINTRETYSSN
jgi:hypothetical protein